MEEVCERTSNEMEEENNDVPMSPKLKELSSEELKAKERKIKRLKAQLRNEEMKLVLMKKIRQSQLMKENISATVNGTATVGPSVVASHPVNPPAKAHVNRNSSGSTIRSQSVLNPPINSRNHSIHGHPPPPLGLSGHRMSNGSNAGLLSHGAHQQPVMRSSGYGPMNRAPVTTPPNVVLGYPVDLRAQSSAIPAHSNSQLSQLSSNPNACASPVPSSEMNLTPAQRQAAAKSALRKQLEKTLLQIPPPKAPPPEMHFIPNANNQEFVYYYGLETIVDFLTESTSQNKCPPEPFECVQCGTDFTPVWKWQDRMDPQRGRPAVICENCVTTNIKNALKAEHTKRLKTAFVKALQQEQEIEQRIASGAVSPPLPSPLPSLTPPTTQTNPSHSLNSSLSSSSLLSSNQAMLPQAPPAHSPFPRLSGSAASAAAAAAAAVASSAALLQQMPKLSAAHQSLFQAQAQQLQQLAQSLPQPQPAHMLPFAPLLYQYGMLGKPASDVHRQYLLDMIPPRSLQQNSGVNWKT
ncbi:Transcriptional repressor p66 alpha-like protein [Leptotrombidium deliense]|uniref:Transcriptional repressor p66 alpha-like protein n=1 Tax=Leptotrombidium deliense TaxID=299467 RepID=A0A443SIB0_9ACAR|nr:Transcriptional repressor p66 alpha-like protein [Leptotrombidium deliense]